MNEIWCGEFLLKNQQHQKKNYTMARILAPIYINQLALRARCFPELEVRIMVANIIIC